MKLINRLHRSFRFRVVFVSASLFLLIFLLRFLSSESPENSISISTNLSDRPDVADPPVSHPSEPSPSLRESSTIPTESHSQKARLLFRSRDGKEFPSELKVVLECIDNTMRLTIVKKIKNSMEFEIDSIPENLSSIMLLHPDFILQTTLDLYQGRSDGLVAAVTCSPAPRLEISGLSELAIGSQPSLNLRASVSAPMPKDWKPATLPQRRIIIEESKIWPSLMLDPRYSDSLGLSQILPPVSDLDKASFAVPMLGFGTVRLVQESRHCILDHQSIELRSGETSFLDLRSLNLASLSATYELPKSWDGDSIEVAISQRDEAGFWRELRRTSTKSNGELFFHGLRPVETRLSLLRSGSPSVTILPTDRELTLKPGENRFEQIFGDARECIVHAPQGTTSFEHEGRLYWEVHRAGRVLARDGESFSKRGPRRYCIWPSDEVRFIYTTLLKGFSSMDHLAEICVLAPNQSEVVFEPREGSAVQLSGVSWRNFRFLLVLQG